MFALPSTIYCIILASSVVRSPVFISHMKMKNVPYHPTIGVDDCSAIVELSSGK